MNERIVKLAEKAGLEYNFDPMTWLKHEKFAELIVRECAGVCESMPLIGPYKEIQDATLKDAAVQIKEHFGIE